MNEPIEDAPFPAQLDIRPDRGRRSLLERAGAPVAAALLAALDALEPVGRRGGLTAGVLGAAAHAVTRTLSALGVAQVGECGEVFDPTVHTAVAQ